MKFRIAEGVSIPEIHRRLLKVFKDDKYFVTIQDVYGWCVCVRVMGRLDVGF
jgi:hypothetical protein